MPDSISVTPDILSLTNLMLTAVSRPVLAGTQNNMTFIFGVDCTGTAVTCPARAGDTSQEHFVLKLKVTLQISHRNKDCNNTEIHTVILHLLCCIRLPQYLK